MFLFNKRTRNIVKWFWGVFATLIILSMVFTYSGFVRLSSTSSNSSGNLTEEEIAALQEPQGLSTSSPEIQELIRSMQEASTSDTDLATDAAPADTPDAPPTPEFQFDL